MKFTFHKNQVQSALPVLEAKTQTDLTFVAVKWTGLCAPANICLGWDPSVSVMTRPSTARLGLLLSPGE